MENPVLQNAHPLSSNNNNLSLLNHQYQKAPLVPALNINNGDINNISFQQRQQQFQQNEQQEMQRGNYPIIKSSHSPGANVWSQEFRNSAAVTDVSSSTTGTIANNSNYLLNNMNRLAPSSSSNMLMRNHAMHTYQSPMLLASNSTSTKVNTSASHLTETQWDQQFENLEKQVSEKLQLQETESEQQQQHDDGITEQNDFEMVWEDLQKQREINETELNGSATADKELDDYYDSYYKMYTNTPHEYKFSEENQYRGKPNAYEMGCLLMEQGAKLSEAILCFEASVEENPTHVDAWLKLGQCNIANELELQGIASLEKVLELDSGNLEAMINLSVSYINEGYDLTAYGMLDKWINGKYGQNLRALPSLESSSDNTVSVLDKTLSKFNHILSNNNRGSVIRDADFQLGLGLLYYTRGDFDKTIDCFQTALELQPNDELMWNRLGATLANNNRSEDAIHAYKQALQLKPTFVRARYNLAVSCINIGCFKEAVEHLLGALSLHEVEGDVSGVGASLSQVDKYSANIMETLKRAFIAMDRRDLLERVGPVGTKLNLEPFRDEFNF
ncbi:related to Peroxisomal targeting signal receptor [Saccharomycodes ludwigii]|uniref:Related to Peroxisomal targeting signal receptor n=2 Tax=Saccharomycodes ludwigii TaxID=36035 RepID=A0A376B6A3_9ASCO|nr:related to Peroxisomal targeting signal receptor [Saccharomycodes ludwigii]